MQHGKISKIYCWVKKKVAFKCIEDDIIYDKIYIRKTTELCAVMKATKLTRFVTLSDGLALDAPKLGGNDMGKKQGTTIY